MRTRFPLANLAGQVRIALRWVGARRTGCGPVRLIGTAIAGAFASGIAFDAGPELLGTGPASSEMMKPLRAAAVIGCALLSSASMTSAWAQQPVPRPVPQVTPQLNNPGPQIVIPPPGNPVQQLAPSTNLPLYSAPQVYAVPEERSGNVERRHHRPRATHRARSRHEVTRNRTGAAPARTR